MITDYGFLSTKLEYEKAKSYDFKEPNFLVRTKILILILVCDWIGVAKEDMIRICQHVIIPAIFYIINNFNIAESFPKYFIINF